MKRVGGFRRKSRHKMSKSLSERGKLHIKKFLQEFDVEDKVLLKAYPSHHKGLFALRFYGKIGNIKGKQGECYNVEIKDGNKTKKCVVHPVHLVKIESGRKK